jgi:hypothetical protein
MAAINVRDYFQDRVVNGMLKAVCTICNKVIAKNVGTMRMHYNMAHQRRSKPSSPGGQLGEGGISDASAAFWKDVVAEEGRDRAKLISKRTLKFLAVCTDPVVYACVIRRAKPDVVKTLCNAAMNVASNPDIDLSEAEKTVLGRYRKRIFELMSTDVPLRAKRRLLLKPANNREDIPESASYIPVVAAVVADQPGFVDEMSCGSGEDMLDSSTDGEEESSTESASSDNSVDSEGQGSAYSDDESDDSGDYSDREYSSAGHVESEEGSSDNSNGDGSDSRSDDESTAEEESVDETDAETSYSESTEGTTEYEASEGESIDSTGEGSSDETLSDDTATSEEVANEAAERHKRKQVKSGPISLKDRMIAHYTAQAMKPTSLKDRMVAYYTAQAGGLLN